MAPSCIGRPDLHSLRHYCLPDHHEIFVVGNVHEKEAKVGSPWYSLDYIYKMEAGEAVLPRPPIK